MAKIIEKIISKAKANRKHIVLPEGEDPRMIDAAVTLLQNKICKVTLLGNKDNILSAIQNKNSEISSSDELQVIDPLNNNWLSEFSAKFYELRKHKGISLEDAEKFVRKPLYFANLMVKTGKADGCVAGAVNTTGDVMRACLQIIGTKPGTEIVSSAFMMVMPDEKVYFFSDCALVVSPDQKELASIAISTADSYKNIVGVDPKVAMLSFSTKGSGGNTPSVTKVKEATQIAKEKRPDIMIDGELQLDAALVESIASKKAPESSVAGKANVLIFPDLNAGNIGYKLVQRLANAEAIGPFVQGLALPSFDLSRGCNAQDIVNTVAICCLMVE